METALSLQFAPRKTPRQDRAQSTVNAILEATLQVLLSEGPVRLNTTLVAGRAGVSVGTLYQYFPNKQSLLFAVLERHLAMLAAAIEDARDRHLGSTLEAIAGAVVHSYLRVRMVQAEAAPVLFSIAMELGAPELIGAAARRSEDAIEAMLSSACDGRFDRPRIIAQTMTAVIFGAVPAFCQNIMTPEASVEAEKQITIMFRSYLWASRSGPE